MPVPRIHGTELATQRVMSHGRITSPWWIEHSLTYSLACALVGILSREFWFHTWFVNVAGLLSTKTQSFVDDLATFPLQRRAPCLFTYMFPLTYLLTCCCCDSINLDIEHDKRSCLHYSNSQCPFWWFMDYETTYTHTSLTINSAHTRTCICTQLYFPHY